MKNLLFDFKNIKEVKFTRVSDELFSMTIEADIQSKDSAIEDSIFETKLCKIGSDSCLSLTMEDVYTNFMCGNDCVVSKCYEIIMPIKLLVDLNTNEIATIIKKGGNHIEK